MSANGKIREKKNLTHKLLEGFFHDSLVHFLSLKST